MAQHVADQLVDAIVAALKGHTAAAQNVYGERTWPDGEKDFPRVLVWDRGGPSQFESMADTDAGRPLARTEEIFVEIGVRKAGDERSPANSLRKACAALAAEVEALMMSDTGIGQLVDERQLIETTKEYAVAGDARRGTWRLTYRMLFATAAGDATAKLSTG